MFAVQIEVTGSSRDENRAGIGSLEPLDELLAKVGEGTEFSRNLDLVDHASGRRDRSSIEVPASKRYVGAGRSRGSSREPMSASS